MTRSRILLLALLLVAVAGFFALGGSQWLTLENLQRRQAEFATLLEANPLAVYGGFFAVYVAATALSLPGATLLTLLAGALFGLWRGLLLVSFASSIGATLAFLAARYVLRDSVRRRFGERLAAIDRGIEREGAFYLFTLRLVPLVPFFVINLAMGLTRMRVGTFYLVSQIGMLAGTVVYVNAGTQLGSLRSLSDVVSPGLLGSFVLLGVFPLIARRLIAAWRARQVYARWRASKPRRFDRNMVVIGGGSAGLVSAYIAAAVKASVTLVERERLGGDCLNTGCVPSKALIRAAKLCSDMRHAGRLGVSAVEPQVDFKAVMGRVHEAIRTIEPHDSAERYRGLGVDMRAGDAQILDPWRVRITASDGSTETLTTRSIVIATGAAPIVPPLPGLDEAGHVTSETLWSLDELPRRLVVLGGGPIGCELAQAFARLGSAVTVVEQGDRLLPREDDDVATFTAERLQADGVTLRLGTRALRCVGRAGHDSALVVQRAGNEAGSTSPGQPTTGGEETVPYDVLLCAVGRRPRLAGLGLETLGIDTASGRLSTDEHLQTIYPNILAAGDVAGPYQFTHAASHQAWYAAVNGLFGFLRRFEADYRLMPAATFVDPEVARVGLNEREAGERGVAFEVTRYELDDLDRAIVDDVACGWVKVLTVPGRDRILGATIVGAHAAELLAEFVLAMKQGIGLNKLLGTIHTYPTMAEANKMAAGAWKRAHQPERLLKVVEALHRWRRHAR